MPFTDRNLLMPECKNFNEIFEDLEQYEDLEAYQAAPAGAHEKFNIIGSFYGRAKPKLETLDAAWLEFHTPRNNKLIEEGRKPRTIGRFPKGYIEVIHRRGDMAQHSLVKIGRQWIALIPRDGMPDSLKPEAFENDDETPEQFETVVHHIGHRDEHTPREVVEMLKKYKTQCYWTNQDEDKNDQPTGHTQFCGNFVGFSLGFSISTNNPELIAAFNEAILNQDDKKIHIDDICELFKNAG